MKRVETVQSAEHPQLTSMIDVVFLLLVFFVCTMTFRVIEGRLDTELPKGVGPNLGEAVELLEPLDVRVSPDASRPEGFAVRLGGRHLPVDQLSGAIAAALARVPELAVQLTAEEGVTHGHVVTVLDEVFAGGAERLRFTG